jgi:hypothetical protein
VSRDAAAVSALVDRAVRRARVLLAAEAAAIGVVVATWSAVAGLLVAIVFAAWRARHVSRMAVVRTLERTNQASSNLLITAEELSSGALDAKPEVRARVMDAAAAIANVVDVRATFPATRALRAGLVASAAWILVAVLAAWRTPAKPTASTSRDANASEPAASAAALRVTVDVLPPAYTGRGPSRIVNPTRIEAIENSALQLAIESGGAAVRIETGESIATLTPSGAAIEHRTVAKKSGFLLVTSDRGERRMMALAVTPDALPNVRVLEPGRDLVYSGGNPRITFGAQATDDYGLRTLVLRYTKVSGSGEQFEFKDGDIPLAVTKTSMREWRGAAARSLAELDLHDGDMLVYRAVAADTRADGGEASSDAFFIEISKLGVAAGDAFTLPEQETRYALSQQMLIVKTDRLSQRRASMSPEELTEASQGLAVEQRMIRSELVFMLGGEVEDEEVEAEQSTELQEGRLANRGQRDLRAATVAMSQAEKLLTGVNLPAALKAERAAVAALERAFSRDRYILRALATRSPLDLSRRLTGTDAQPVTWRRVPEEHAEDRRAALLQSLLQGLGETATTVRSGRVSNDDRGRIAVLAELAVRADVESPALRQIAADLQQLADTWSTSAADVRARALDAIAARVAQEVRRAFADAPAALGGAR